MKKVFHACVAFVLILGAGWLALFLDTYIHYMTVTKTSAARVADSELQRRINQSRLEAGNYSKPILVSEDIGVGRNRKEFKFIAVPKEAGFPIILVASIYSPNDRDVQSTYTAYVLPSDAKLKQDLVEQTISSWKTGTTH